MACGGWKCGAAGKKKTDCGRKRERGGCHCITIGGAATPTPQSNIRWDGMGWEVVSKKRQHKRARTHLSLSLSLSLHNAVVKSEKKRERTAKGRE